jgi:hypothetical protein
MATSAPTPFNCTRHKQNLDILTVQAFINVSKLWTLRQFSVMEAYFCFN